MAQWDYKFKGIMLNLIAQTSLGTLKPPSSAYSQGSESNATAVSNLEGFLSSMIGLLTVLAGVFFIVYFLMAAFKWLTAGGDSGKVSQATTQITQGVIGLVLVVAAFSIIGLIGTVLGLNLLRPGQEIMNLLKFQ